MRATIWVVIVHFLVAFFQISDLVVAEDPLTSPANASPDDANSKDFNKKSVYGQYALRHAGDAANGKQLFSDKRTKCDVCHKVAGNGGDVGKDLSSISGKFGRPHLIESLLDPSRQIVEGYRTTNVLTEDGKVISGIVKKQSDTRLTIVDATGKLHAIRRDQIDQQDVSDVSIMPEGLTNELSMGEFTDLIAYLETLGVGNVKRGGNVKGAISLPDGFTVEVVATAMDGLTALEALPDGRLLVCEQPGQVRVIENGGLLDSPFVSLPVDSNWERGVIGVTCDPDFTENQFIYVCWIAKDPYPHHRVSRFTMQDNVAVQGSEKLLLVGDDQSKMGGKVPAGHQGGAIHFGPDGKLYIAIGEQTSGMPAQKLDTFLGKVLRINSDGSIPNDNPLISKTKGKYQAIWAYGCRNPFTFAFRKSDGLMLINDVGGKSEEINVGRAGANYGWPVIEHGDLPEYKTADYDGPIHWYPQSSLNGGDFCPTEWPEQWRGKFFFADFQHGWINVIDPSHPKDAIKFASGIRQPVDMRFSPDGSLYVLLRNAWVIDDKFGGGTGSVIKITPGESRRKSAGNNVLPKSISIPQTLPVGKVLLTEDAVDDSADGMPAFKIETPSATYFLEKEGGGLSSLVDRDGNDWLGFHPRSGSGAAGEYRGFPNAVHKQGGSYFHAMNAHIDAMNTYVDRVSDGYVSIIAESSDQTWQGRYEFFATHCTFTITKMPSGKKYWVLYEGTPGGEFSMDDWWMTSAIKTPQQMTHPHEGDIPDLEWIAFGDSGGKRSVVMLQQHDDNHPDTFYQMNREMTVFGFGRQKLESFQSKTGLQFSIGLVESTSHQSISAFAHKMAQTAATDFIQQHPAAQLGPRPGDVYREYAIHNGGNLDWRVTDPNAKHKGAQAFLPNPILNLTVGDLQNATRAEAVLDRWGGHVGTREKLIRFNGNDWISLPELSTTPKGHAPERYYSQDNPVVAIPLEHLQEGGNVLEAMIGPANKSGWGQWGLYSLILRVYYDPLKKGHASGKIVSPVAGSTFGENPVIKLECDSGSKRVDVLAWYDGYDEDGNGVYNEWHGTRFQPLRGTPADLRDHVGTIETLAKNRELTWKTRWVPDQKPNSIKIVARVHHGGGLVFVTNHVDGLSLERDGVSVKQYRSTDVPEAFGVRIGNKKSCNIPIAMSDELGTATDAVLHYRTWEGDDRHHEPFQLNGHPHLNQGNNHHYDYDLIPIPISELRTGNNTFTIHSNTEHHMIEVLWPGPALTVRFKTTTN